MDSTRRIRTASLAAGIEPPHGHLSLAVTGGQELVLAVNEVPYPWHRHPDSDEVFILISGRLTIGFEDAVPIELTAGDIGVVGRGMRHRTIPHGRTVNLILKRVGASTEVSEHPPSNQLGGIE